MPLADVIIRLRIDGLTLEPAQTPLILLIFPNYLSLIERKNLTKGTLKKTSP